MRQINRLNEKEDKKKAQSRIIIKEKKTEKLKMRTDDHAKSHKTHAEKTIRSIKREK